MTEVEIGGAYCIDCGGWFHRCEPWKRRCLDCWITWKQETGDDYAPAVVIDEPPEPREVERLKAEISCL